MQEAYGANRGKKFIHNVCILKAGRVENKSQQPYRNTPP